MRRAMAALAWLPDEDAEVPSTSDLQAPFAGSAAPLVAGAMAASLVGDAAAAAAATTKSRRLLCGAGV